VLELSDEVKDVGENVRKELVRSSLRVSINEKVSFRC